MSDPIVSFQGLVSGIQFRDLVDQIIAVESRPAAIVQERIQENDRRTTAWGDFDTRVETLEARGADLASGDPFNTFTTSLSGFSSSENAPISVSTTSSAEPGSFSVEVLQLAQREKLGSDIFDSRTTGLGFSGDLVVNDQVVTLESSDTLNDLATKFNQANTGDSASGVSASVVSHPTGGYRLVLTASQTGAEGISLRDAGGGLLGSLGLADGTTAIRNATSDGATSDGFSSSTIAVGSLLGLATPPASGSVTIGGLSVTIDLANDSLDDVAASITTAAGIAGSAITAEVISETADDGTTTRRLDLSGTTAFSDTNGILETLGVVERGRGAVSQTVTANAFTDGDASTPATGSTLLTDFWASGGASEAVADGDSLTISGTRGDGSVFTKTFNVTSTSTYQDLVDSLNDASDAFGSGSRTATVSIDSSGALVVTDDTGGDSRLALSIVANNEGGGTLDFGSVATSTIGRDIEISRGQDAQVEIDGTFLTRSRNVVTDVVAGVTINLDEVSSGEVTVEVERDLSAAVDAVDAFVKAYNAVSEYVNGQFDGAGAEEDRLQKPLSGDSILRQMRSELRGIMETRMTLGVTGDLIRLADIGIEVNQEGTYDFDQDALRSALETDATSVTRLFSNYGTGSTSSVEFVAAGDETESGIYGVEITTAAAQATVTGTGFSGTYVDDGTPDTLTITDAGTESTYDVELSNGMSMAEIVDAINLELQTTEARVLQSQNALFSDAVGTAATDSTLLQDLYDEGGTTLGIADGDIFSLTGSRSDGSSFAQTFEVTDVATQTIGQLRASLAEQLGGDILLEIQNGRFVATAREEGRSSFTFELTSDNTGGGSFDLGTTDTVTAGRSTARITASEVGGQLSLVHTEFGSAEGFDLAFTAGGGDGSASLGVSTGSIRGVDVAGTIGGLAATGAGRVLTGGEGTAVEGLLIRYSGATTGSIGNTIFSRGIASRMELLADSLADNINGSIKGILDGIDLANEGLNDRLDQLQARLDRRRENLIRQFTALETQLAEAQSQGNFLLQSLAALPQPSSSQQ